MSAAVLVALLLLLILAAYLALRPRRGVRSQQRPPPAAPMAAPVPPVAPAPSAAAAPPPELSEFRLRTAADLSPAQHAALLAELRTIPRPPRSLHQLISPEFLGRASSAELNELVMAEPVVAARVVAAVNSSLYGLRQPVGSIGQAVTFLGLNSVRGICLQYMLDDSFKAADAPLKAHFDALWRASAVASELCQSLAPKLQLAEPGALVTQVVLSFLGQFASASLLRRRGVALQPGADLLERTRLEQQQLGLGAAELGFLLMQEWTLPASLIEEVRASEHLLVTPAAALPARPSARLVLGYLCARLGERIVQGKLTDLSAFDPAGEPGADFHHLHGHLAQPALARLTECLRAPELLRTLSRMMGGAPARI